MPKFFFKSDWSCCFPADTFFGLLYRWKIWNETMSLINDFFSGTYFSIFVSFNFLPGQQRFSYYSKCGSFQQNGVHGLHASSQNCSYEKHMFIWDTWEVLPGYIYLRWNVVLDNFYLQKLSTDVVYWRRGFLCLHCSFYNVINLDPVWFSYI